MEHFIRIMLWLFKGVFWGFFSYKVTTDKGYSNKWFFLGFFFGVFGLLIAVLLPDLRKESRSEEECARLPQPSWTCAYCGNRNPGETSSCLACQKAREEASLPALFWQCPKCSANNPRVARFCPSCGEKQPETPAVPADCITCARCGKSVPKSSARSGCPHCGSIHFL
jgi:hypothetical protein